MAVSFPLSLLVVVLLLPAQVNLVSSVYCVHCVLLRFFFAATWAHLYELHQCNLLLHFPSCATKLERNLGDNSHVNYHDIYAQLSYYTYVPLHLCSDKMATATTLSIDSRPPGRIAPIHFLLSRPQKPAPLDLSLALDNHGSVTALTPKDPNARAVNSPRSAADGFADAMTICTPTPTAIASTSSTLLSPKDAEDIMHLDTPRTPNAPTTFVSHLPLQNANEISVYLANCRFEHPGANNNANANPFSALSGGNNNNNNRSGFGRPAATSTGSQFSLSKDTIQKDLAEERPSWLLSAYGPGRDAPEQLWGGYPIEQSFEEMRLHYMTGEASGNPQGAVRSQPSA